MSDLLSQFLAQYTKPMQFRQMPMAQTPQSAFKAIQQPSAGAPGSIPGIMPSGGGQSGKGGGAQPMTGAQMSDGSTAGGSGQAGKAVASKLMGIL